MIRRSLETNCHRCHEAARGRAASGSAGSHTGRQKLRSLVEPTDVPPDSVPPEQRPISRTAGLDASPPRATYFASDNGDLFSRVRMSALRIPPPTNAAVARPATGNVSGGTEVGARVANLLEDLYGSDLVESPPPTAGAHPRARGAWD